MTRAEFGELVRNLNRKLYLHAYRMLGNQMEAEDVVQDVFIKLWKMNMRLGEYNSIEALAKTMVKNGSIDQIRKSKLTGNGNNGSFSFSQSEDPSPHEQMERSETASILDGIISRLPENYSELIRLRDIEGLSYEEISEKVHLNINAIRVNISRARKMVRIEFKKYYYEQSGDKRSAG